MLDILSILGQFFTRFLSPVLDAIRESNIGAGLAFLVLLGASSSLFLLFGAIFKTAGCSIKLRPSSMVWNPKLNSQKNSKRSVRTWSKSQSLGPRGPNFARHWSSQSESGMGHWCRHRIQFDHTSSSIRTTSQSGPSSLPSGQIFL